MDENNKLNEYIEKTDECKLCLIGLSKWTTKKDIINYLNNNDIKFKFIYFLSIEMF